MTISGRKDFLQKSALFLQLKKEFAVIKSQSNTYVPFMLPCAKYKGIKYVVFLKKATYCKIRLGFFLFFIDFYVFSLAFAREKKVKLDEKK